MRLPEGNYQGQVVRWFVARSTKKNTPYLELDAKLTHYEDANGQWTTMKAPVLRPLVWWLNSRDNPKKCLADIQSLGYGWQNFAGLDPKSPEKFDFLGKEVSTSCQWQEGMNPGTIVEKHWFRRAATALEGDALSDLLSGVNSKLSSESDDLSGEDEYEVDPFGA
jgi:hypothetical protein